MSEFRDELCLFVDMFGNRHFMDPRHVAHVADKQDGGCVVSTRTDFNLRCPASVDDVLKEMHRANEERTRRHVALRRVLSGVDDD